MKQLAFLISFLLLITGCTQVTYIPVSRIGVINRTGYELHYRVYKTGEMEIPEYRIWEEKTRGYEQLEDDTSYTMDVFLIGPEREMAVGNIIYKVKDIFGDSSFVFNSGHDNFEFTLFYEDGQVTYDIRFWER